MEKELNRTKYRLFIIFHNSERYGVHNGNDVSSEIRNLIEFFLKNGFFVSNVASHVTRYVVHILVNV